MSSRAVELGIFRESDAFSNSITSSDISFTKFLSILSNRFNGVNYESAASTIEVPTLVLLSK